MPLGFGMSPQGCILVRQRININQEQKHCDQTIKNTDSKIYFFFQLYIYLKRGNQSHVLVFLDTVQRLIQVVFVLWFVLLGVPMFQNVRLVQKTFAFFIISQSDFFAQCQNPTSNPKFNQLNLVWLKKKKTLKCWKLHNLLCFHLRSKLI